MRYERVASYRLLSGGVLGVVMGVTACSTSPVTPTLPQMPQSRQTPSEPSQPQAPAEARNQAPETSVSSSRQTQSGAQSQSTPSQAQKKQSAPDASARSQRAADQPTSQSATSSKAGRQSEDDILSDALKRFERNLSAAAPAPGETARSRAQTDAAGPPEQAGMATLPSHGVRPSDEAPESESGKDAVVPPAYGVGTGGATGKNGKEGIAGGRAITDGEHRRILDAKFDEKLKEFDGLLLDKRAELKAEQKSRDDFSEAEQSDGVAGAADSREEEGSGNSFAAAPSARGQTNSGGGGMPPIPHRNRKGDYESTAAVAPLPSDIPSGDQDDVVARQLREAAMKETDPELREKLWNEYRKYKGLPVKK